ncbi:ABC transporter substrate-binding protein [Bradyrhizobium prioriisuperbiae]|uniref:ABC transporter substrate-binding protein n=1 Tax=Bradyrhizobium prioriisuperbiae TaxID=2854389 RepID=UPI0028E7B37A|nr:ABC transporter substrate-binding protein [Bradyrhizobium prioritasuperba]
MLHLRHRFRAITSFLSGSLFAGLAFAAPATAADAIRVRLDWTPWGDQAPFHLAQQSGLFKKYGLDVTLDDGNGSVSTVQIVGNGEYDVGHASLAPMAIARSKGLPVKAIAGFIQENDIGLLVPKDGSIKGPADLKGKKIAFTAGSLEAPFIDRFLAAGKLKRDDVELLNVDAAGKAGMYMTSRTDAAFSSVPFFLAVVEAQRPSTAVRFSENGLKFPSFGLFATEKTITAKRDPLKRFVSVVAGCWAYIFNGHEDEGVKAIIAARPQSKLDPKVLRQQIDTLKDYALTEAVKSLPFGSMALGDWQQAVSILSEGGLLGQTIDPKDLFTNDLIDPKIVADVGASLK